MKKTVIKVESLSKMYNLDGNGGYYSLRDYISELPQRIINKKVRKSNITPFWALKDVSFELNKGDVLGIIGKNGAGKSTLLKILSRVVQPTSGEAIMNGKVASMLEIGTGFNSELTGRENIYLNGAILGMKKKEIENKFKSIVEFSEIGKFLDMPVKKYSSGMYVRLAFSVAAHLDPEIVLLDEVLAVGDLPFQRKSLAKMRSIAKDEGRTVIYVSHNLSSVESLCNKTMLLENGKLTAFGKTHEVVSKYISSFDIENNKNIQKNIGELMIKKFWVENQNHEKIVSIKSGDHCFFYFQYFSPKPINNKIDFGFTISTIVDQPLLSSYLSYTNQKDLLNSKEGIITFEIPSLPLIKGEYKIAIQTITSKQNRVYSSYNSQISVKDGDFYQKNIVIKQSHSPIYIGGNWTYTK